MSLNPKVAFLLLGLLIGGVAGYLTRPEAAELKIGDTSIEVQGDRPAKGSGEMTSGQTRHVLMYTLAGGVLGLLVGFAAGRRR